MRHRVGVVVGTVAGLAALGLLAVPGASARPKEPRPAPSGSASTLATVGTFSSGQLNLGSGCGTNPDGEPAVRISYDNNVVVASERGLGNGSDAWHGPSTAGPCALAYSGQPNAVSGTGASGGDVDIAIAPALDASGQYRIYVSSLNLGSVSVAHSDDGGATYTNTPVQAGVPGDDREWIAAFGQSTALLSFHDITTGDIDVLRSDDGGSTFKEVSQAIPLTDPKAENNQHGNLAIDHRNTAGATSGQFWAYQSFVAPSNAGGPAGLTGGTTYDEAFLAVSSDGGSTWTDRAIPCSTGHGSLDHQFPNVTVAPNGTLWMAWSNDTSIFTATSSDHGQTWSCSPAVSTGIAQSVMPWITAGSAGVDLVFYGAPTSPSGTWYVEFAQNTTGTATGWAAPQQLMAVHQGAVCESGASCTTGRQLFDDFGVDVDTTGMAHIAFSQDSPSLGGSGTSTGYAVQTAGTGIGNNN